jgi:RNA polymerase sigma-70 factor (ECF subfamily)
MGSLASLAARRGEGSADGAAPDDEDPAAIDARLVVAARAGDPAARDAIYRRHARMVLGLAHRLLAGASEADDLLQDVFVIALSRLDRLEDPRALRSWLGGITTRVATRRLKWARWRTRIGLGDAIETEQMISPETPPDVRAELRALYRMVGRLRPVVQVALVLRRVEGMTLPEIAAQMDCSVATVKRYVDEAEVLLRAELSRGGRSA